MDALLRVLGIAVPVVVILAGLGLLGYGLRLRERSRHLRRVGSLALGRVVDNRPDAGGYLPVVRFRPPGRDPVTVTGRERRPAAHATGTQVQVRYDPADPGRAEIVGQPGSRLIVTGGAVIAGFGVLVGLIVWAVS